MPTRRLATLEGTGNELDLNVLEKMSIKISKDLDPYCYYLCPLYVNFQKNRILYKPNEANG